MSLRDEQIGWLQKVLSETGLTRHALAVRADIPPPTLTMFVNAKTDHKLSSENVRKIELATGIRFNSEARRPDLRERESEPYNGALPVGDMSIKQLFGQANGIEAWTLHSRAVECAGYLPGDILVVDINAAPKPGDLVCAQIYDWGGAKADTIFRIWEPPYLQPATMDTALRRVFPVDNDRVFIAGVVVCMFRPRGARAA